MQSMQIDGRGTDLDGLGAKMHAVVPARFCRTSLLLTIKLSDLLIVCFMQRYLDETRPLIGTEMRIYVCVPAIMYAIAFGSAQ